MKKVNTILVFLPLYLSLAESAVVIKLGSYSNKDNLVKRVSSLEPYGLARSTRIMKEDNMYKAYSLAFFNKKSASEKLPIYRNVFPDAYIMQSTQSYKPRIVPSNIVTEQPNETAKIIAPEETIVEKSIFERNIIEKNDEVMVPIDKDNSSPSLNETLQGHTFYICPDKISSHAEKLLIRAKFEENGVLNYTTIIGNVPPLVMGYVIQNERFYLARGTSYNPAQFTQIDETFFEYYLVSKWSQGKKLNDMRYYTNQENAKAYLNSIEL